MNYWRKILLSGICILPSFFSLFAGIADTILLDKVVARGVRFGNTTTGAKFYTIDSLSMRIFRSGSLADLLQQQNLVAIKTHGPGGLATVSVRGGSSRNTAIIWNGLSLRNPMSGEMNFSALPVGFMDEVSIQPGGSSTMYGSGAASGIIFLNNKLPLNNSGWNSSLNAEIGSFGSYSGIITSGYHGKVFSSRLRFGYQSSENNFRFINHDAFNDPVDTLKHASFNRKSIIHQSLIKIGKHGELQTDLWYVNYYKNIPAKTNDTKESTAYQEDDNFRVALNYSHYFDRLLLRFRSGYLYDKTHFYDSSVTNNISQSVINEIESKYAFNDGHFLFIGLNSTTEYASSEGYIADTSRLRYAVFGRYSLSILHDFLNFSLESRQEVVSQKFSPFVFSLGTVVKIIPSLHFKGVIARHYALPIMDDLFWKEDAFAYGNPDLLPEYGWNVETGIEHLITRSGFSLRHEITFFRNYTYDLIQWQSAGIDGKWTPVNVDESLSRGIEFSGKNRVNIHKGWVSLNYMYSFTDAILFDENSKEKPRTFVPRHNAAFSMSFSYFQFRLQFLESFVGKSYYDDSHALDAYMLGTLLAGYDFECNIFCMDIYLKINNVFNVTYKVMPGYAQPPRSLTLGINFNF